MTTKIHELPVSPEFNVTITLNLQQYLNLIRTCAVLTNRVAELAVGADYQKFMADSVSPILADVTANTDAHICSLIKMSKGQ